MGRACSPPTRLQGCARGCMGSGRWSVRHGARGKGMGTRGCARPGGNGAQCATNSRSGRFAIGTTATLMLSSSMFIRRAMEQISTRNSSRKGCRCRPAARTASDWDRSRMLPSICTVRGGAIAGEANGAACSPHARTHSGGRTGTSTRSAARSELRRPTMEPQHGAHEPPESGSRTCGR